MDVNHMEEFIALGDISMGGKELSIGFHDGFHSSTSFTFEFLGGDSEVFKLYHIKSLKQIWFSV
jgi:hypothetical protein